MHDPPSASLTFSRAKNRYFYVIKNTGGNPPERATWAGGRTWFETPARAMRTQRSRAHYFCMTRPDFHRKYLYREPFLYGQKTGISTLRKGLDPTLKNGGSHHFWYDPPLPGTETGVFSEEGGCSHQRLRPIKSPAIPRSKTSTATAIKGRQVRIWSDRCRKIH